METSLQYHLLQDSSRITINPFFLEAAAAAWVSLTLVTSFFETSKLWACIIFALEGLECQG